MKMFSLLLAGVLPLAVAVPVRAEVSIKQITYHNWQNAYQMSNGTVELVFVPQIGRIMRYGYVNGPNLLWENPDLFGKTTDIKNPPMDWPNYGGDKLWPAPQNRWGWPPDPAIDSAANTVKILKNKHLLVTGTVSAKHGIRFSREIVMEPTGTGTALMNTMTNTSDKAVNWSVWEVAQVDSPDVTKMPLHKGGKFSKGYYVFKDADPLPNRMKVVGEEMHLERDTKQSSKIGGDAPAGWLAAEKEGVRFEIASKVESGREYPDDGCALEIYTNPDPTKYVELEHLSPIVTLAPGKSHTFTTRWKLSRPMPEKQETASNLKNRSQ